MLRMTKDGETTVPSSEEYARQLETEGWTYLTEGLVQPKPLPSDFPMREELAALGITTTTQVEHFLVQFSGVKLSLLRKALGKVD